MKVDMQFALEADVPHSQELTKMLCKHGVKQEALAT